MMKLELLEEEVWVLVGRPRGIRFDAKGEVDVEEEETGAGERETRGYE